MITNGALSVPNFRGSLIKALVDDGHEVLAMAPDWTDELRSRTRALGAQPIDISLDRTGVRPFRDLADCWRLRSVLRNCEAEAVLCYFAKPAIFGSLAAWAARVPRRIALIEGLGYLFADGNEGKSVRRKLLRGMAMLLFRIAMLAVQKVVFLNCDDAGFFRDNRLARPEKIAMLGPIGVDLDKLRPIPPFETPVTFALIARLLREKGVCDYVEAARIVKDRHGDTRFLLIGDRDANPGSVTSEELQSWTEAGIVEWPGHVDNVEDWLARTSVFVLPSYYREGVPRSTQEAAALGRAIITTDAVGCRETVVDGRNGFMVPVRSVDELGQAMLRFVEEPELIARMGAASRTLAEERFDARIWNERMAHLLTAERL